MPAELKKSGRLHARWFIFGEGPNGCDLSDGEEDVFWALPKPVAERIMAARDAYIDELENILASMKPQESGDL